MSLSPDATVAQRRANWLELFYDLVFAAAVITFSDAVSQNPTPAVIGLVSAAFVAVWLVWLATTVYVNTFGIDDALHRALIVIQMLALTLSSLAIGDGIDRNPELASVSFGVLALDVAIMYGRQARHNTAAAPFATMRRNQFFVAALPILVAAFFAAPVRAVLWPLGIVLVAIPALGFRVGGLAKTAPVDEPHLVERLGLLTIIVIGEAFVKVSLVVTDGHLDGIDAVVLVALFIVMFAIWWAYFDDIPDAGIRDGAAASIGWLLGHLVFQLCLVGIAVAYAKWLQLENQKSFTGERSLLGAVPFVGFLLALALIGLCTRRVPRVPLAWLRVGTALIVVAVGLTNWQVTDSNLETAAIALALLALAEAGFASRLQRATHITEARTAVP
jgi:low temperature requirement protein LtrA